MVTIPFLHPNVFNVLKYLVFSLTVGCSADIVLNTFMRHSASRTLLKKGRCYPAYTPLRTSISLSNGCHFSLIATIFLAAALEIALDFSTGATSIWTTSTQTFRISKTVSNVSQLLDATSGHVAQLRDALQRAEGICFNVYGQWYSPVSFNLTNFVEYHNLGDAALCPRNRSGRVDATPVIQQSSFSAAHILQTNFWNRSQLTIGRDTHSEEDQVPYDQVGNVRIGALEKYSFIAANVSDHNIIPGSERSLTGNSSHQSPWALQTVLLGTSSNAAVECFASVNWIWDDQTGEWTGKDVVLNACLIPIIGNKSVLGLYDDVAEIESERYLIMSVALEGVTTFHDMHALKAIPFLMGRNNRMHTNRELAILAVLCSRMITAFSLDGVEDVRMEVDDELVTVPTWSMWGIALFFVSLVVLVGLKVVADRLGRNTKIRGNLVSAKGIAEHWLSQEERFGGKYGGKGQVVLVVKELRGDKRVIVGVQRAGHFGEERESIT